jgi:hypothetical protein
MPIQSIICDFSGVILQTTTKPAPPSLSQYYLEISQQPNYSFNDHFQFNLRLLDFFKTHTSNLTFALFSSSELYSLTESAIFLDNIFDCIFTPDGLGFSKVDPDAYFAMSQVIEIDPDKILFIDDEPEHVKAALHAGLQGAHFHNTDKLLSHLYAKISSN